MPKRTVLFTDLETWGIDPDNFVEEDRPAGNLRQSIGQIFREHRNLLTKQEWAVVERRYCLDCGVRATARELKISREWCRKLTKSAFEKLLRTSRHQPQTT